MSEIEQLCIKHFKVNKEITDLKKKASESWCSRNLDNHFTCIQTAYNSVKDYSMADAFGGSVTFNEVWDCFEDWLEFKPCDCCVEQRRLKRLRVAKQIERGHIRSAISRIGKSLSANEGM